MASFLPLSLCAALVGCAAEVDGLGEDDELPDELVDGKADSLTSPTLRGELLFGRTAVLDYDKDFRNLAVDFSLSAKATVDLTTFAFDKADDSAPVALYLYKKSAAGVWRKQVRTAERYTELSKELSAGTYRVSSVA